MTTTADRFHDALLDIFDEDPNRSRVLWGAFRAAEILLSRAPDVDTWIWLEVELDEFAQASRT
jgi:hypothetical protein